MKFLVTGPYDSGKSTFINTLTKGSSVSIDKHGTNSDNINLPDTYSMARESLNLAMAVRLIVNRRSVRFHDPAPKDAGAPQKLIGATIIRFYTTYWKSILTAVHIL